MKIEKLYVQFASLVGARLNCIAKNNGEWKARHEETIEHLVKTYLPSGSGWDLGTKIDLDKSSADKLVFYGSFHHMNEAGMYDGYSEHTITLSPSLAVWF